MSTIRSILRFLPGVLFIAVMLFFLALMFLALAFLVTHPEMCCG